VDVVNEAHSEPGSPVPGRLQKERQVMEEES
jgi:hypothetical protein